MSDTFKAPRRKTDQIHVLWPDWPADDEASRFTAIRVPPTTTRTRHAIPTRLDQADVPLRDASIDRLPIPPASRMPTLAIRVPPGKRDLNIPTEVEIPWQERLPPGAIGLIRGRVTEAASERALPDATIRLVLPDDDTVVGLSDETGRYELAVPPVPKFFAVSAWHEGYVPESVNVPRSRLKRGPVTLYFKLEPQAEHLIALEAEPDVHHLGNDRFEGRINSQFQKRSEGRIYRASFMISDSQLEAGYEQAEVRLMAKGVQRPHAIRINGMLLPRRLNQSPRDGGFGIFSSAFDPAWLKSGRNTFKIHAKSCRGDLDDFEFVNVRIILAP